MDTTTIYDHFARMEQMARTLKAVGHSDRHPRFFRAWGLEDLFTLADKISAARDFVLIAVDGYESRSTGNRGDGLAETRQYGVIIARSAPNDQPSRIAAAFSDSRDLLTGVRNRLLQDPALLGYISRDTEMTGIGPIGDNFYGCLLTFSITQPEEWTVDESLFTDL